MADHADENLKQLRSKADRLVRQLEHSGDLNKNQDQILHELRVYQAELEMQNQQLRETQSQLQQTLDRFNCLYHQSPVGYVTIDNQGRIQDLNESFAAMLGYPSTRLRLKYLAEYCTKESADILRQRLPAFFKHPDNKILDLALTSARGATLLVEVQGRMLPGEPFLACNVIDRTQRKLAEEARRDTEAQLRAVTAAARNAILMINSEGLITFCNPATQRVLGYEPQELLGRNLHQMLAPKRYREDFRRGMATFRDTGQGAAIGQTLELVACHKDGTELDIELSLSSVSIKGEWHAVGIIRDQTKSKNMSRELSEKRHELEKNLQQLTQEKLGRATLMEITQDGIGIINQEHRLIEFNQSFADMLGYTCQEMKELHTWDWEAVMTEEQIRNSYADLSKVSSRFESRHRRKDGSLYDVEVSASGSEINGDKVVVCISRDITERKLAEQTIEREKQFSEETLKALPGVFYMFDEAGTFVRWNEHFKQATGYTDAELAQKTAPDFFKGADRRRIVEAVNRVFVDGYADVEAHICHRDGHCTAYHFTGTRAVIGGRTFLLGVGMDIAERKQAEEALHHRTAELQQRTLELERFNYTASHDLKSPLVTIKTFLGFLEADLRAGADDKIAMDLHYIRTAVDRMSILLDDLLNLSQFEWFVGTPREVSLRALLEELLIMVKGQSHECRARIITPLEDIKLYADPSRLLELWQNLVDNAMKYCPQNREPHIEIGFQRSAADPSEVEFYVRDNGMGIEAEYHDKIFGLFEKLDRNSAGSGLGLTLVKRIIEKNGGRIWVESLGEGQGSCFRFTLPAALRSQDQLTG